MKRIFLMTIAILVIAPASVVAHSDENVENWWSEMKEHHDGGRMA